MQLFDSAKMYVFAFCLFVLITVANVRHLTKSPLPVPVAGSGIENIVIAFITLCLAAYLAGLLRKLSSRIEQIAVVLFEVSCMLDLADWLANLGMAWAKIPHYLSISEILYYALTGLAGVRAVQVLWSRRNAQEE